MKISVVVPTYNRCSLLTHAINSILRQSLLPCEILVVDDGSTDATPSIVEAFGERVKYVSKPNGGKSSALNVGFAKAQGDVVVVFDDDDLMPVNALEQHARALNENPSAEFSYGRFIRFEGDQPPSMPHPDDVEIVPVHDRRRLVIKLMENCFLPNPTWAVRRDAARAAGSYREGMSRSQDYDMILRLARNNEGAFIDAPVLFQRKHTGLRGPSHERVHARDTIAGWTTYDRALMQRLDQEWSLTDFRPFSEPLIEQGEDIAWLQRGVIMFIKKAYEPAFRSFDAYRKLLGSREPTAAELGIAASLLSCRYGIGDLIDRDGEERTVAHQIAGYAWPLALRRAFCTHLRWRTAHALSSRRLDDAVRFARFGRAAFGSDALLLSASARVVQNWLPKRLGRANALHRASNVAVHA